VGGAPERDVRLVSEHPLLSAMITTSRTGHRTEPHVHRAHAHCFYVLDGNLTLWLGPDLVAHRAGPGVFAHVPPDVVHGLVVPHATFVNLHAPDGAFAAWIRDERPSFDSFDPPAGAEPHVAERDSRSPRRPPRSSAFAVPAEGRGLRVTAALQ
jgi:hypothetical protein